MGPNGKKISIGLWNDNAGSKGPNLWWWTSLMLHAVFCNVESDFQGICVRFQLHDWFRLFNSLKKGCTGRSVEQSMTDLYTLHWMPSSKTWLTEETTSSAEEVRCIELRINYTSDGVGMLMKFDEGMSCIPSLRMASSSAWLGLLWWGIYGSP